MTIIQSLYEFVIESTQAACIIVCLIVLLQRIFRNTFSPRWHYLLWLLLVAKLVIPLVPESPISISRALPLDRVEPVLQHTSSAEPIIHPNPHSSEVTSKGTPYRVDAPLRLVWLMGCAGFCIHMLVMLWTTRKRLGDATPVTDPRVLRIYEESLGAMSVSTRPALLAYSGLSTPVVYGLFHPSLLVPPNLVCQLSDNELRHVFLHELSHVKRRDLLMALLTSGLQALHWFNPFVWYGLHRMRQDRELACDALAMSRMTPEEAADYGRTLVKLMGEGMRPMRLPSVAAILEHESQLKRRIKMILRHKSMPYRLTFVGFAVFMLCAAVFLTRASAEANAPSADSLPYVIPVEMYETSWSAFRPGDSIVVTELRGSAPEIKVGETYQVKGHYVLASAESAWLMQWCTNGDAPAVPGTTNRLDVQKGKGEFVFKFTVKEPGMLHVSYYPTGGGNGFGDGYFRKGTVPANSPDARVDLSTDDSQFLIGDGKLLVRITNKGNTVSPKFKIWFYEGDPQITTPRTHEGGPIAPGETWNEGTSSVNLKEGQNTLYVKIDPDNAVAETDETNNEAKLTVKGRKVMREVIEVDTGN